MKVPIWTGEVYPAYRIDDEYAWCDLDDIDPAIAAGWQEAQNAYDEMQRQIRDLIERPCEECGHFKLRHQVPKTPSGFHGCLARVEDETTMTGSRTCRCTDWSGPPARYTKRSEDQ